MNSGSKEFADTGERIVPPSGNEVSIVYERHRFAYRFASQFVDERTVVDVGCGTGYGSKLLSERAHFVLGIDYDSGAVEYCRNHFSGDNICFLTMDAANLGIRALFDVAVSFQVIEHFSNLVEYIDELKRIVKSGGKIIISTPNVPVSKQHPKYNPFHHNEFNSKQFFEFIRENFLSFQLFGLTYESGSIVRNIIQKIPGYRFGRLLKRDSKIKKYANRHMNLTRFKIVETNLDKSMDLIAVCTV